MLGAPFRLEQVLLTTLVVKLAVVAALATMLVRYRRFRHILIFERRAWPDRLIFILFFGIPLAAGVVARLLLNYYAADLSLEGAFLAGLIAGPYAGATVGLMVGLPPLIKRLHQLQHDALRTRIAVEVRLEALDRQTFGAAVEHAFKAAGATQSVVSDAALELLFRASRGVLRVASKIVRVALRIASDKNQPFLDEHAFEAAVAELGHAP